jgi:hypothetical protein
VPFEQTTANTEIERTSFILNQNRESLFKIIVLFGLLKTINEQLAEEIERVLIHGIDVGKISNDEIKNGAAIGDRSVALTS